jgi:cold shock protein
VPDPEASNRGINVPTGKVKWFNPEKGFGFLAREGGPDVFVHKDALPAGTEELKPGQRVEFGIVAGRRGDQALQVRILDPLPSVAAKVAERSRKKPDELMPIIEDLIKLLDDVGEGLRRGRHPDRAESRKVASVLRAVATDLES